MHGRHKRVSYTPWGPSYITYTPLFRLSFLLKTFQHIKRCFVYEKIGCWSSNHTQQERDDSKKKFGDYYLKYKARSGYERNLQY